MIASRLPAFASLSCESTTVTLRNRRNRRTKNPKRGLRAKNRREIAGEFSLDLQANVQLLQSAACRGSRHTRERFHIFAVGQRAELLRAAAWRLRRLPGLLAQVPPAKECPGRRCGLALPHTAQCGLRASIFRETRPCVGFGIDRRNQKQC